MLIFFFNIIQVPKNPDLPVFQYRLTEKPEGDRIQICNLNKGFCDTNCGGPNKVCKSKFVLFAFY